MPALFVVSVTVKFTLLCSYFLNSIHFETLLVSLWHWRAVAGRGRSLRKKGNSVVDIAQAQCVPALGKLSHDSDGLVRGLRVIV